MKILLNYFELRFHYISGMNSPLSKPVKCGSAFGAEISLFWPKLKHSFQKCHINSSICMYFHQTASEYRKKSWKCFYFKITFEQTIFGFYRLDYHHSFLHIVCDVCTIVQRLDLTFPITNCIPDIQSPFFSRTPVLKFQIEKHSFFSWSQTHLNNCNFFFDITLIKG